MNALDVDHYNDSWATGQKPEMFAAGLYLAARKGELSEVRGLACADCYLHWAYSASTRRVGMDIVIQPLYYTTFDNLARQHGILQRTVCLLLDVRCVTSTVVVLRPFLYNCRWCVAFRACFLLADGRHRYTVLMKRLNNKTRDNGPIMLSWGP